MNINRNTSHPSAFISSTFADLKKERRAVADILEASNINVNALDIKPASNDSSRKEILRGIKESDFIIVIVGQRYGSINFKITLPLKVSITKWEYTTARRSGKSALVYFKDVRFPDPDQLDDDDSDFDMKQEQLKKFKKELTDRHNSKYFETPDELAHEVRKALIPMYRDGVLKLLTSKEDLGKEIERLKDENQMLRPSKTHGLTSRLADALIRPDLQAIQTEALSGMWDESFKKKS